MRFDPYNRCECRPPRNYHDSESGGPCKFCQGLTDVEHPIFDEYGDIGVDIYRYLMTFDTPEHQKKHPGWATPKAADNDSFAPFPWSKRHKLSAKAFDAYYENNAFRAMLIVREEMIAEEAAAKPGATITPAPAVNKCGSGND